MLTDDHFGVHDLDLVLGVVVSLAAETRGGAALKASVALLGTSGNAQPLDLNEWLSTASLGLV